MNTSAVLPDSGPAISSSNIESEVSSAPVKSHAIENGGQVASKVATPMRRRRVLPLERNI